MTSVLLEINCGHNGGPPVAADHILWHTLTELHQQHPITQLVLFSEIEMWQHFPDKYRLFLNKLGETLPDVSLQSPYKIGSTLIGADNRNTKNKHDCNIRVADIDRRQTRESTHWRVLSHSISRAHKKQALYKALNLTDKQILEYNPISFKPTEPAEKWAQALEASPPPPPTFTQPTSQDSTWRFCCYRLFSTRRRTSENRDGNAAIMPTQ
mgnify:CR=1 FL=1